VVATQSGPVMCMHHTFAIVVDVEHSWPVVVLNHIGKCPLVGWSHESDVAGGVGLRKNLRGVVAGRVPAVGDGRRVERGSGRDQRHGEGATERRDRVGSAR